MQYGVDFPFLLFYHDAHEVFRVPWYDLYLQTLSIDVEVVTPLPFYKMTFLYNQGS